jgi:hypothetical protein
MIHPSMDFYSGLLTVAAVAAVAGLIFAVLTRLDLLRARLVQWPPLLCGASIALVVAAGVIHLFAGHGQGSPEPMEPIGFLSEHPVLIGLALVSLLALGVNTAGRK